MSLKDLSLFALVLLLGTLVLGGIAFGWTAPSLSPPSGNVSAPLNTGASSQTKSGNLTVNQLTASIANGTAPLVVTSQTKVANLNADLLDGLDSSGFGDATLANQTTMLGKIGTSTDAANMDTTLFGGLQYLWDNRTSFGTSLSSPLLWFGSNSCGGEGCNTSISCPAGMTVAVGCKSDSSPCASLSVLGSSCVGATSCSQTDGGDGSSDAFVGILCTR